MSVVETLSPGHPAAAVMTRRWSKDMSSNRWTRLESCPEVHRHTKCPKGYLAWHEWADRKSRRHYQVLCPGCGLFAIWRRKPKGGS